MLNARGIRKLEPNADLSSLRSSSWHCSSIWHYWKKRGVSGRDWWWS